MIGNKWLSIRALGLIIVGILMTTISVMGEEEGITLEATTTHATMGSSMEVTLTVHDDISIKSIKMKGIDQFDVLSNSQSSTTQIINGVSTHTITYHITLMPKGTGEFVLQAVVNDGHKDIASNDVRIEVDERDTSLDDKTEDVFITTELSSDQVYLGEPIVLSYNLFTRYNLDGFDFTEPINIDGALVKEGSKEDLNSSYVTIAGNKYLKYEVKQLIINPIQGGSIDIPSYNFQANISTGDFFSSSKPKYLTTEAKSIEVVALPTENRPENYSGLVGDLTINSSVDREELAPGEPATLKVEISGKGNLSTLEGLYPSKENHIAFYETDKGLSQEIIKGQYNESTL